MKNRWNWIARELFVRSGKQFFRNPKQCRERWMNHLDPTKIRSEWTASEDLVLLSTIKRKGKRWSLAVRELNHTRTEHMVKNRYKSLISNEAKKHPDKRTADLEALLIKRLTKTAHRTQAAHHKQPEHPTPTPTKEQPADHKQEEEQLELWPEGGLRSPLFLPWGESAHNAPLSLLEDDKLDLDPLYEFSCSENESFLRF